MYLVEGRNITAQGVAWVNRVNRKRSLGQKTTNSLFRICSFGGERKFQSGCEVRNPPQFGERFTSLYALRTSHSAIRGKRVDGFQPLFN